MMAIQVNSSGGVLLGRLLVSADVPVADIGIAVDVPRSALFTTMSRAAITEP